MKTYILLTAVLCLAIIQCAPSSREMYIAARNMEEKGDFPGALDSIDKALEHDPDNAEYLMSRGYYLSRIGRIEEAIASYRRSYKADDQPHVGFCLADLLAEAGRYKEAEPYAIVVVSGNTGFVPAVTLLTEIELALWKTENAEQCIQALDSLCVNTGYLKSEMKRRNAVKQADRIEEMRGIKNHVYLKTGTVLTGTSERTGTETEESLFAVADDRGMADVIARMSVLAEEYGEPVKNVISFPAPGGNVLTDILIKTAGAKFVRRTDTFTGLSVWVCMENYSENNKLRELVSAIRKQGGKPLLFSYAVSRSSLRKAVLGPHIAGIGGMVKIDTSLHMSVIAEHIMKFIQQGSEAYIREQNTFYSGPRAHISIKKKE